MFKVKDTLLNALNEKVSTLVNEGCHDFNKSNIDLSVFDNTLCVSVSRMYNYVEVTFDMLEKLSKVFNTRKINFKNGQSNPGCETCDYGSRYEVDIWISDIDWKKVSEEISLSNAD